MATLSSLQVGGFRREVDAFLERWVYGSGCPTIRGALHIVVAHSNTHIVSECSLRLSLSESIETWCCIHLA